MKVHFLGGAHGVTGSRFLVESSQSRLLVDCGLFQGLKELRMKNWSPFPVEPSSIDAILLTHAHLDHSGYIPRLFSEGFNGPVFCTAPTKDLCQILLSDSGHLQEEEAQYRNRKGTTKHRPALALYTEALARQSLHLFQTCELNVHQSMGDFQFSFQEAGHILGASSIVLEYNEKRLVFSGDLGRYNDLLMTDPAPCPSADYVFMESTYGDRLHPKENTIEAISNLLKDLIPQKGVLLIPAFAVGRAQTLLYVLHQVFQKDPSLRVPVYLNSPMAVSATHLFQKHNLEHKLSPELTSQVCDIAQFVNTVEDSRRLNEKSGPMVIISASGMLSGGRILHHIKAFAPSPRNALLLVGFQAPGTRGYHLANGAQELKIHGQYVPIKAQVHNLQTLSAHGDQSDLLEWIHSLSPQKCKGIYLIHGEPAAADALRVKIKDQMEVPVYLPHLGEVVDLRF